MATRTEARKAAPESTAKVGLGVFAGPRKRRSTVERALFVAFSRNQSPSARVFECLAVTRHPRRHRQSLEHRQRHRSMPEAPPEALLEAPRPPPKLTPMECLSDTDTHKHSKMRASKQANNHGRQRHRSALPKAALHPGDQRACHTSVASAEGAVNIQALSVVEGAALQVDSGGDGRGTERLRVCVHL